MQSGWEQFGAVKKFAVPGVNRRPYPGTRVGPSWMLDALIINYALLDFSAKSGFINKYKPGESCGRAVGPAELFSGPLKIAKSFTANLPLSIAATSGGSPIG